MLAFPSAHAADGVSAQQLLIGQTITLQGGKNDYGVAVLDGVQAYLAQVNRQGGIADRKVVVKVLDDDNKPAQAEANARELITKDKVFIVFGSIEGGPSNAVMTVTNELKVPFLAPWQVPPHSARRTSRWSFPCAPSTRRNSAHCLNTQKTWA